MDRWSSSLYLPDRCWFLPDLATHDLEADLLLPLYSRFEASLRLAGILLVPDSEDVPETGDRAVFQLCTRSPTVANRAPGVLGVLHVTAVIAQMRTATAHNALAILRPAAVRVLKNFAVDNTDQKDRVSWVQIPDYEEAPSRQQARADITLPYVTSTDEQVSLLYYYTDHST